MVFKSLAQIPGRLLDRLPFHTIRNCGLALTVFITALVAVVGLMLGKQAETNLQTIIDQEKTLALLLRIKAHEEEAHLKYTLSIDKKYGNLSEISELITKGLWIARTIATRANDPKLIKYGEKAFESLQQLQKDNNAGKVSVSNDLSGVQILPIHRIQAIASSQTFIRLAMMNPELGSLVPVFITKMERLALVLQQKRNSKFINPEELTIMVASMHGFLSKLEASGYAGCCPERLEELRTHVDALTLSLPRIMHFHNHDATLITLDEELAKVQETWNVLHTTLETTILTTQENIANKGLEISADWQEQLQYTLTLFAIALVFTLALAIIINGITQTRISRLTHGITHFAAGNYAYRIMTVAKDDLSRLGIAINLMASRLARKEAKLRKAMDDLSEINEELEDRVARRTEALETANRRLAMMGKVFEHSHEGILVTDTDTHIIDVNPAFTDIVGYSREDVLGQKPNLFKSDRHDDSFYVKMWNQLNEQGFWQGEIWNKKKNGNIYPQMTSISSLFNESGELIGYVSVLSDYSDRKRKEDLIRHQATHDHLTQLPNRAFFMEQLDTAIMQARETEDRLAMLFIDLDDFKDVNDTLGHEAGDKVLIATAKRLKKVFRSTDIVCRLGGDEFVVLMTDAMNHDIIETVANRAIKTLCEPVGFGAEECRIGVSIGISLFPDDAETSGLLMQKADAAMYKAKQNGKNQITFCDLACLIETVDAPKQ